MLTRKVVCGTHSGQWCWHLFVSHESTLGRQHNKRASTCSPRTRARMFPASSVIMGKKVETAQMSINGVARAHVQGPRTPPPPTVSPPPAARLPPQTSRRVQEAGLKEPRLELVPCSCQVPEWVMPVSRAEARRRFPLGGWGGSVLDPDPGGDYGGGSWRKEHRTVHVPCT